MKRILRIPLTLIIIFLLTIPIVKASDSTGEKKHERSKDSIVLIEKAYRNNEIDEGTALVYKAYTLYQPELLPEKFVSDKSINKKSVNRRH